MKRFLPFLLVAVLAVVVSFSATAQGCSMCAGVTETSTQAGASAAAGINKGVMYIFMMPYLIIGTIWFFWWRAKKKATA